MVQPRRCAIRVACALTALSYLIHHSTPTRAAPSPIPASQALEFLEGRESIIARLEDGAKGAAYRMEVAG